MTDARDKKKILQKLIKTWEFLVKSLMRKKKKTVCASSIHRQLKLNHIAFLPDSVQSFLIRTIVLGSNNFNEIANQLKLFQQNQQWGIMIKFVQRNIFVTSWYFCLRLTYQFPKSFNRTQKANGNSKISHKVQSRISI